jgi:integrase
MVALLEAEHIKAILSARADTPFAADYLKKLLKRVLNHAERCKMIPKGSNPVNDVDSFNAHSDGHHTWTEEDLAKFEARHPLGTMARTAYAVLRYTGQRRSDGVAMGPANRTGDRLQVVGEETSTQTVGSGEDVYVQQIKTKIELLIPIHSELRQALAATDHAGSTFIATSKGKPFSPAGFGNWFRERCDEAGLKHCSAHGLRKRAATDLAEAGCTTHQIMSICGFGIKEAERYTRAANQKRLAREGMAILEASERRKKRVKNG